MEKLRNTKPINYSHADVIRFGKSVDLTPPSGCWHWVGSLNPQGYGAFGAQGDVYASHRFAYTVFVGPIPEGLTLDHLCRNTWCVNPEHLEPVTQAENNRRADPFRKRKPTKDACSRGHEYSEHGKMYNGRWSCLTCQRINNLARYHSMTYEEVESLGSDYFASLPRKSTGGRNGRFDWTKPVYCKGCNTRLRNRKMKVADYPDSLLMTGRGMCATCYKDTTY